NFENIGIVQASGTAPNGHSYSFKDAGSINSGKDVAYYRLVASDKDGKTKNTNIISLKLGRGGKWNVVVLSNPVQDNLKLLLSGITAKVLISISDVSGKIIYKNSLPNVNGQISIPAKLQRGVHVLTVETNDERKVIQFIKQ
ncbi:MAG: T9SS type A sorting domain-containing protein, partial [Ginsengibacter sp.]